MDGERSMSIGDFVTVPGGMAGQVYSTDGCDRVWVKLYSGESKTYHRSDLQVITSQQKQLFG